MDFKSFQPHNYPALNQQKNKSHRAPWLARIIFLIFTSAVFVLLFGFILPTAEVTIYFTGTNFEKEFEIYLDKNISQPQNDTNIFPAKIYEASGYEQKKFTTTGQKDNGDQAIGSATFYNFTGRSEPLTVAVELIHQTGKVYFLKNELTIPAAQVSELGEIVPGKVMAEITAKEGGESYNQNQNSRLNISVVAVELQSKIYAEVGEIKGGTSKIVTVMSVADLDNATSTLVDILTPKLKNKIKDQLKKGEETMRDELTFFEIQSVEKTVEIDKEAKDFEVKLNGTLRVVVFNETALQKYLKAKSLPEVPVERMIAEDDLGELQIAVEANDLSAGQAKLKIKARYATLPKTDLNEIKEKIKGLSEVDARRVILALPNIRDVHFSFALNLWNKLPNNLNKIKIKVGNK